MLTVIEFSKCASAVMAPEMARPREDEDILIKKTSIIKERLQGEAKKLDLGSARLLFRWW